MLQGGVATSPGWVPTSPNLSRVGPNLSWPYGRSRVPIENRTEGLLDYWTESLGKEDLARSTAEGVGGFLAVDHGVWDEGSNNLCSARWFRGFSNH